MARIPQQIATRGLETGSVVQYPSGSPVGGAIANAGDMVSQVADRWQQQREELDNFKLRLAEQQLDLDLAGDFDAAQQAMPADGAGFHDSFVGEIDPDTGVAMKPGLFDDRAKAVRESLPEGVRGKFDQTLPLLRREYSNRAAAAEYKTRQGFYRVETERALGNIQNSIGQTDPDDEVAFTAYRQQGEAMINTMGIPALEKRELLLKWQETAAETSFQALLARDAQQAKDALGVDQPRAAASGSVVDRIIGVESGGNPTAKNPNSSATGLGQFTSSTWMATVRKYEPQLAEGKSRAEVLALRSNGTISRRMTAHLVQENSEALTRSGVPVTDGTIYLAHFAGSAGAASLLKADPNASAQSVLGSAAVEANPFLRGKTAADVIAWADRKMGSGRTAAAPSADRANPRFQSIPFERRLQLANAADGALRDAFKAETDNEVEERRAITKDGYDMIRQDQITPDWLEAHRDILNVSDYKVFSRALEPETVAKRTPPKEYLRLLDLADQEPERALEEVRDAYGNGIISKDVFNTIRSRAESKQDKTTGRNYVSELRSYVSTAMTPDPDAPESQYARKLDALFSFDDWIEENQNADREAIRKHAQAVVNDFKKIRYASGVTTLPLPRYTSATPETMDALEVAKTRARLTLNLEAGRITEREAAEQASIIRRWDDIVRYRD